MTAENLLKESAKHAETLLSDSGRGHEALKGSTCGNEKGPWGRGGVSV